MSNKHRISVTILTVHNAHNYVFYLNSDINKDKPYLMNDAKQFISCFFSDYS